MSAYKPGDRVVSISTVWDGDDPKEPGRYGTISLDCRSYGPVKWDDDTEYLAPYNAIRPVLHIDWSPHIVLPVVTGGAVGVQACSRCGSLVIIGMTAVHQFDHERQQPE